MPNLITKAIHRLFQSEINDRVQFLLTGQDGFYDQGGNFEQRDRFTYDRESILLQALEAWRVNPLARRIVELTTQYVIGGGLMVESKHEPTDRFIKLFWNHPLNQMPMRVFELCDELTRSGELFILLSTDAAGMSYIRAIPAGEIAAIQTTANDLEQETSYTQKAYADEGGEWHEPHTWPAYLAAQDDRDDNGQYTSVILHYAINRPAGAVHGESDLAPLLRWLTRYSAWLEDRARLNRFRQTFLFVVKSKFATETERAARQAALNVAPPSAGSILVTDDSEEWSVINPELDSADANTDGMAIKKMIAAGSGIPLHFLAEPESSTRTTAESAGGPTFRHFEQRQVFFVWMVSDVLRAVIRRRAMATQAVRAEAVLSVRGADISGRDNTTLSVAASTVLGAFQTLRDRGLIDDHELLRIVYKFAGEVGDLEEIMRRGSAAPTVAQKNPAAANAAAAAGSANPAAKSNEPPKPDRPAGIKIDPVTGDAKCADNA